MKLIHCIGAAVMVFPLLGCGNQDAPKPQKKIGSNMNHKFELALSEVPVEASMAVLELQPDFKLVAAEKEFKHGDTYIDLEGTRGNGIEVEFDLLQQGEKWVVVERQRDISLIECPVAVVNTLRKGAPGFEPVRIMESDQLNGIIIYDFFAEFEDGNVLQQEVKYEDGQASLLQEEWRH